MAGICCQDRDKVHCKRGTTLIAVSADIWGQQGASSADQMGDSPEGAIVSPRGHDAILIHCHAVHNGFLVLQHVVQELALH